MDVLGLRELKSTSTAQVADQTLKIRLSGCDDGTTVEHTWTKEQAETLIEFAKMVNANASYSCEVDAQVWHDGVMIVGWDAVGDEG